MGYYDLYAENDNLLVSGVWIDESVGDSVG